MQVNKINFKYFDTKKVIENEIPKIVYKNDFNKDLSFNKNNVNHFFEYCGFSVIKTKNTNKSIKELLFNNYYESYIKINGIIIKNKDVIIISPFTKISDILSSKTNGNLHHYLKEQNCFSVNNEIETFISQKIDALTSTFNELIDIDLSKCDVINYIDIKDEFITKENIKKILEILKQYENKKLIIFNDVDYLDYDSIMDYINHFNFLYFVNDFEENYKCIDNYEIFLIEYDCL